MKIYEQYHELLDQLVTLNKESRQRYLRSYTHIRPAAFALKFCTIVSFIGRDTGSTSYAIREASTRRTLVICPTVVQAEQIQRQVGKESESKFISAAYIDKARGLDPFELIIVDNIMEVSRHLNRDLMYLALARNPEQTFIILGA